MKVIGYVRVSTSEQEVSGLGLESQRDKIHAYCGLYDLELVSIVQDAVSGKSLKGRNGLDEALAMLKTGYADGLIVAKLDRLTRSVKDLGYLLEKYFSAKHSLFVVQEQVDTRTASGRLVLNLLTSVAQWERETIGERTSSALTAKRNRGEKTGGDCPFGYGVDTDGRLVADSQEQSIIRIVDRLRDQGYGYRKIAAELNNQGYHTKRGVSWCATKVMRVVNRKFP